MGEGRAAARPPAMKWEAFAHARAQVAWVEGAPRSGSTRAARTCAGPASAPGCWRASALARTRAPGVCARGLWGGAGLFEPGAEGAGLGKAEEGRGAHGAGPARPRGCTKISGKRWGRRAARGDPPHMQLRAGREGPRRGAQACGRRARAAPAASDRVCRPPRAPRVGHGPRTRWSAVAHRRQGALLFGGGLRAGGPRMGGRTEMCVVYGRTHGQTTKGGSGRGMLSAEGRGKQTGAWRSAPRGDRERAWRRGGGDQSLAWQRGLFCARGRWWRRAATLCV